LEEKGEFIKKNNRKGIFNSTQVDGDSMSPTFELGDLLLCRALSENENIRDNKIYAVNTTESVMVKRVQKIDSKNNKALDFFDHNWLYNTNNPDAIIELLKSIKGLV